MGGLFDGIFGGADAAERAARVQGEAIERGAERLAPFREAGVSALTRQQELVGLSGQEAQQQAIGAIQESPGQRFIRQRAQRNLLQNASAIGGLGGGNIRSALVEQGAGFASQDIGQEFSRLQALSGGGLRAAGATSGLDVQGGQAQAQGILQAQQANAGLVGQLLQVGSGALSGGIGALGPGVGAGQGAALALISDENLKHDIRKLSPKECYDTVLGLKLKAWKYLDELHINQKEHFGPMSQDAPPCIKIEGEEALDLHDELNLIAGAIQYINETWSSKKGDK